jgi:hypothetical protein
MSLDAYIMACKCRRHYPDLALFGVQTNGLQLSEEAFENFARADAHASKEQSITTSVIPIIDGEIGDPKCVGGGYPLGNLAPLTDSTLTQAKPDHFFGAHPEQLDHQICKELSDQIIPSTQNNLPNNR